MTKHDVSKELNETQEIVRNLSPEALVLTEDIQQIMDKSSDPLLIATLLYKLVKEREETNKLLGLINDKYDKMMLELKTGTATSVQSNDIEPHQQEGDRYTIMSEQDQLILKFIEEHGSATAQDIKTILNYKGLNAASQRLNKLYKENHLKKVVQGKKVLYLLKT